MLKIVLLLNIFGGKCDTFSQKVQNSLQYFKQKSFVTMQVSLYCHKNVPKHLNSSVCNIMCYACRLQASYRTDQFSLPILKMDRPIPYPET